MDQRYRKGLGLIMSGWSMTEAARIEGFSKRGFLEDASHDDDLRQHWLFCSNTIMTIEYDRIARRFS